MDLMETIYTTSGIKLIHSVEIHPHIFSVCFCKGFNSCNSVWDFLLGVSKEPDQPSTVNNTMILPETSEMTIFLIQ